MRGGGDLDPDRNRRIGALLRAPHRFHRIEDGEHRRGQLRIVMARLPRCYSAMHLSSAPLMIVFRETGTTGRGNTVEERRNAVRQHPERASSDAGHPARSTCQCALSCSGISQEFSPAGDCHALARASGRSAPLPVTDALLLRYLSLNRQGADWVDSARNRYYPMQYLRGPSPSRRTPQLLATARWPGGVASAVAGADLDTGMRHSSCSPRLLRFYQWGTA